jgi:hypothetical protein
MLPSQQILIVTIVLCLVLIHHTYHSLLLRNDEAEKEMIMTAQSILFVDNTNHDNDNHPKITAKDTIYSGDNTVPIVNEEYKIIFFPVSKVASPEWLRLFMRLNNDPNWCSNDLFYNHKLNGLKYLTDYSSPQKLNEMMTSPKWTRAIFVRHPVPRILSSFLDVSVQKKEHFESQTCLIYSRMGTNYTGENTAKIEKRYDECVKNHFDFEFFLKEITTTLPDHVHWRSIYSRIDEKWWPYINVIGSMDNLSGDAKALLKSIHSNISGKSAWDEIGKSGLSDNEIECKHIGSEFFQKKDKRHTINQDEMKTYYTPELEKIVEERYADDMNNTFFHFEPMDLFKDEKA